MQRFKEISYPVDREAYFARLETELKLSLKWDSQAIS